jgi:hypothetical protein
MPDDIADVANLVLGAIVVCLVFVAGFVAVHFVIKFW